MLKNLVKSTTMIAAALGLSVAAPSAAFAHVTVKPGEVPTASYQVFTVNVPNEKSIATVKVSVQMPVGVTNVTPTNKSGWSVETEKQDGRDETSVTSITWSGGQIGDGTRDEFSFSAKTPDNETELKWKAFQTYADGTVVSWDKEETAGHSHQGDDNSGPLSITSVSKDALSEGDHHESAAPDAGSTQARIALYTSIVAVVVALVALFVSTRQKS